MNVRERSFVGWHNLEILAIPPRERDVFYRAAQNVWCEHKSARFSGILTPVGFSYMTDKTRSGSGLERDLVQNAAEVEYNAMSLGAFSRCAWYSPTERFTYPWKVSGCGGAGAELYVLIKWIEAWYVLGICRLLRNITVDYWP